MEASLLNSFPSTINRPNKIAIFSEKRNRCLLTRRKSSSLAVYQGEPSSVGNMKRMTGSSVSTLKDQGNLVLPPNNQKFQSENMQEGIGIVSFLKGKRFFITGGTGFLAKVLIEKILSTAPDVGKIYLLIKAKNEKAAMERLKNEIINKEIFKGIRQTYGNSYQEFILSKLVPVVGNVCGADLGLGDDIAASIAKEVDVVINSAANTTFHERYDVALDTNTKGPYNLMAFAKKCEKLKLFLQVSTAYVNGQRQGRVMEKPFRMGETITRENESLLNVENEMKLAMNSVGASEDDNEVARKMKDLGLERARKYGWQDTYVFTKAMGEMVIDHMRGHVPVVVIRPSVIESTCKEPFPGWMEGNRMMDPIVLNYGKGLITGFLVDPASVLDVIPADMVVNAILAAIAKHGMAPKADINVYQITSSVANPLVFEELLNLTYEHYKASPLMDSKGMSIKISPMKSFRSMQDFSEYVLLEATQRSKLIALASSNDKLSHKLEIMCKKWAEQATYFAKIYEPYTFYGGRFDNNNVERLMASMSEEEKKKFGFDVGSLDWKDYIKDVHIPGLKTHVLKGRGV